MLRLASLLLLLALAVLLLWPDASPDPAVSAARRQPPRLVATENAFYLLAGLGVRPGREPAAEGFVAVSRVNALLANETLSYSEQAPALVGEAWVDTVLELDEALLCAAREPGCPARWWRERDALRALAERHALLLRRYARLREFPRYRNEMRAHVHMPFSNHRLGLAVHRLQLAVRLLDHLERGSGPPRALLEDLALQRRLLAQADDVLAKMVALSNVADTVHVYAALLDRAGGDGARGYPRLPRLNAAEKSLDAAVAFEFRLATSVIGVPGGMGTMQALGVPQWMPDILLRPLFKPQHSLNLTWACFERMHALASRGPSSLPAHWPGEPRRCPYAWHDYLINPIGTVLLRLSRPGFDRYAERLHDVDGLLVLADLKRELRAAGQGAEQIPARLASGAYVDPYTGAPVRWDSDSGLLSVASPRPDEGYGLLPLVALP